MHTIPLERRSPRSNINDRGVQIEIRRHVPCRRAHGPCSDPWWMGYRGRRAFERKVLHPRFTECDQSGALNIVFFFVLSKVKRFLAIIYAYIDFGGERWIYLMLPLEIIASSKIRGKMAMSRFCASLHSPVRATFLVIDHVCCVRG